MTLRSEWEEGVVGPPSTAAERAYTELRHRILDGRLPGGHRLKEIELAKEFGVSRTPIRDALSRLSAEGLLEFRPNQGATVSVWSEAQIEQMFRIRALLEPFATEIAATQITREEVDTLRELCQVMEQAARRRNREDLEQLSAANSRFHRIIIDAAHSEHLTKLISLAIDAPLSLQMFGRYTKEEIDRSMRYHRDLVDALSHGDPAWASSVMRSHILSGIAATRTSRGSAKASPSPPQRPSD
jgi:DNA-binding GntR family transcriptional regulator